jgi:protein TonB
VQQAKLVRQLKPVYPQDLKVQGMAATVKIKAIISKTGDLLNPKVVNTVEPALAQAALDAVKQWQYSPTLLNGQPIEVLTTIDVVFELDQ